MIFLEPNSLIQIQLAYTIIKTRYEFKQQSSTVKQRENLVHVRNTIPP